MLQIIPPRANSRHLDVSSSTTVNCSKLSLHRKLPSFHQSTSTSPYHKDNMFSKLTTKIALRKAGIPSSALSIPDYPSSNSTSKDGSASPFANPFKDLEIPKSLLSWKTPLPPPVAVVDTPILGTRAPNSAKFRLPAEDGRSTVVLFLRHTGCPCEFFISSFRGKQY